MNVYQLKPKYEYGCCGGMALVAAPTYERAVYLYMLGGNYAEALAVGDFSIQESCRQPVSGLAWSEEEGIICDSFYFE